MSPAEESPETPQPAPCPPCRGTGEVVSNLGGTPKTVACPWCEGTGTVIPGRDAQAQWRAAEGGDS